jgi:hypothetical protein
MQSAQQSSMAYFVPIMNFNAPAGSGVPATPPVPPGSGVPVQGWYPNDPYYGSVVPPNPPGSCVPAQGYDSMYGSGVPPNPPGYVVPAQGYDSMCGPGGVPPNPPGCVVPAQGYDANQMHGSFVPVAKSGANGGSDSWRPEPQQAQHVPHGLQHLPHEVRHQNNLL